LRLDCREAQSADLPIAQPLDPVLLIANAQPPEMPPRDLPPSFSSSRPSPGAVRNRIIGEIARDECAEKPPSFIGQDDVTRLTRLGLTDRDHACVGIEISSA
jgi:hypothetical protein